MRQLFEDLRDEWVDLDRRIKAHDDELAALTRDDAVARRLATAPGIGAINATPLLVAVGDGSAFSKGARPCRLARIDATAAFNGWQDQAARDQQA